MDTTRITTHARAWINGAGDVAHRAIDAGHAAGEQLAATADARWRRAMRESAPQLSAETRRNANQAKRALGRRYQRALVLARDGAHGVVDTAVGIALAGTDRAASLAPRAAA